MQNGDVIYRIPTFTTAKNQMDAAIQRHLADVNTAIAVKVTAVDEVKDHSAPTGWVTVKQLVKDYNNDGKAIDSVEVSHIPYMRYQGGKCAFIADPCVGDIGLAVFAKNDCSNIKQASTNEVTVGSYRQFNFSDGFYIGGFLQQAPSIYIELLQDGHIVIHPASSAQDAVRIEGHATINGNLRVNGTITTDGSSGSGDVTISGKVTATGDVKGGGISLDHHTHPCPHGGNTGEPN